MMPNLQQPPTGELAIMVSLNLSTPSLVGGEEPPRVRRPFERLIAARQ